MVPKIRGKRVELVIELRFERVDIGRVSLLVEPFVHYNEVLGLLFSGVIEWDMDCLDIGIEYIRERRGHTVQRLLFQSLLAGENTTPVRRYFGCR